MKFTSKHSVSIQRTLLANSQLVIAMTLIPLLFLSLFFLINIRQYQQIIENVNQANTIKSQALNDIEITVWYLVTGKEQEDTDANQLIYDYQSSLLELKQHSNSTEQKQSLDVAIRILDTIDHYTWQIKSNITNQEPVADSEQLFDEIQDVNSLLSDTLQEYVVGEINLAKAKSESISQTIYLTLVVEIILVIGLLLLASYNRRRLDQRIKEPLYQITQMVSEVAQGNLDVQLTDPGIEEFDQLVDGLNIMSDQINLLLEQNTQKQRELARSEMKVLQAQINPHFIYNSLDAILSLAQKGDNETVAEIIFALSNFFKITLNNGNEWITVAREITHVKSYLDILKIRYGPILQYMIEMDDAIAENTVLKMILQPLVENAMYHGIKNNRRRGMITVKAIEQGESLQFQVIDNGLGMTPENLRLVQANLEQSNDQELEGGYGLYNVARRIRLYYGAQGTITVTSELKKGTSVTIMIPKQIPTEAKEWR